MKKFVSMLVVLAMVLSMTPNVFAVENATSGTIEAANGTVYTTDTWTAESDGILTISVDSEEGVGYKVYINGEAKSLMWAMTYADTVSYEVATGDTVYLEVRGYNPDSWSYCDATINWAYSFNGEGALKEAYAISEQTITTAGSTEITMIDTAEVTIVTVTPAEAGTYTITVGEDALIANCGGSSAYIYDWANVTPGTSLEWTCQSVGQNMMLGIKSDSETVAVTVEKTGEYVETVINEVVYQNTAIGTLTTGKPADPKASDYYEQLAAYNEAVEALQSAYESYTLPADAVLGGYVDISTSHTAVLGEDGYYHLDSEDGAILLVDLDYIYNLTDVLTSDRPVMYVNENNEDGSVTRHDISPAVQSYYLLCDENGYYPLTEDLIYFYSDYVIGTQAIQSFYLSNYEEDTAWMFACLTMTLPEAEPDGSEGNPYIIGSLPYDIEVSYPDDDSAFNGVYYQYTAEQDGSICIKDVSDDFNSGILSVITADGEWFNLTEGSYAVTEGETVLLCHWATWQGDYDLTLQYAEEVDEGEDDTTEDDTTGDDTTETTPDSGEWSGTDVDVAADEVITIVYTPETNGTLSVDVSCETGWQINVNSEFNAETVWSDTEESPVSFNLTAGTTYTIEIVPYNEANGWNTCDAVMTYELTWTAESTGAEVEGSGTDEDPYVLLPNADNYANVVGYPDDLECDGVYFCWEATADGTLTLTFDEDDPQPYVYIYVNSIQNLVYEGGDYTATADLTEGDYVYILVETYDFDSAEYTFYASFGGEEGGEESGSDTEDEAVELYDGDNYLSIWAGEGTTPYTYIATQSGTLYLTFTEFAYMSNWGYTDCSDYMEGYFGIDDYYNKNWMMLTINDMMADTYYGCVEVTEGDVISIGWEFYGASEYVQANYNLYATLNLNYEGFVIPEPGSIDAPYEMYMSDVDWGMGQTVEVAAGAAIYYILEDFGSSNVTITGAGDFTVNVCSYDYDEYWNEIEIWTAYEAVDGKVDFAVTGYGLLICIENNSEDAATYEVDYYYPVGHPYNPEIISGEGDWTASLDANSNGYYYQWTVGDDTLEGVMTITVGGESWQYYVSNDMQYIFGDYHYSKQDGQASEDWSVFAGDVFTFWVSTDYNDIDNWDYDTPAGDVTITITFEEKELVQGVDYPYYVSFYDELPVDITVGAGEEAWVKLDGFNNYYFTVTGDGAYVVYNGVTFGNGDGVVEVMISDYTAEVYVVNASDAEVTYSVGVKIPVGDSNNPHIITENGEYVTSEFTEGSWNQYYFQYTATEDGTITVEVLNDTYWQINLWNKTSYASAGSNYRYAESNTFTMNVSAGDLVQIYGRTYSYDTYSNVAGTLRFNFTFEAAPEDTSEGLPLYDGVNKVYTDNTDGAQAATKYTYIATQTGTLYLTFSNGTYTTAYGTYEANKTQLMNYTVITVNGEALSGGYCGTIEVTEGDEITITWKVKYAYYKYLYMAILNLSYEGYDPAPGSEADPIDLSAYDCPADTVEIAAGSTVYYSLKYFSNSYITVTGAGAYIVYNGETYTDTDGDGVIMLYAETSPMLVQIGNSGDSTATFSVGQYYPVGSQANPETLGEGEYAGTVEKDSEGYYFTFVADCDMDLTLTFSSEAGYQFAIINYSTGMIWDAANNGWSYMAGWNEMTGEYTITLELYQGDELSIGVNTQYVTEEWDTEGLYGYYPAGTIDLVAEIEYYHADDDGDGLCDFCDADLNEATVVYGDVNGDGEVNLDDADLVVSYFNGATELNDAQLAAADVNGDGEVDILDANMIVGYLNGTVDTFPAENNG